ncbi:MAG TPA: nucleotidyltransferase domain-containing protein [Firmicutes bacterium]|nr:nucleotidyltransferase domain-containing protein [Bacillota bacterium]
MPVRSLSSSVLKWPDRQAVHEALVRWLGNLLGVRTDIQKVGYFGSYARGDWGPGSDLDLIVVLDSSDAPFGERSLGSDILDIPVSVDLLVYTADEWRTLERLNSKFYKTIMEEAVWIYVR